MKLGLFPLLLVAGCLTAGLYGALHDQVSYTVSPDYFHSFKFLQFDVNPTLRNRAGASVVGWHATWWMGLLIGIPVMLVGLILPEKAYLKRCLVAFAVVAATALIVGLIGLGYATTTITEGDLSEYWVPPGVVDRVAFARVGVMHGFSYVGGFLGILTASAYLVRVRVFGK